MSTVQKDKDSLWTAVTQDYFRIKTVELGVYRPDRSIYQVNKKAAARWHNHQSGYEPHLHDNY